MKEEVEYKIREASYSEISKMRLPKIRQRTNSLTFRVCTQGLWGSGYGGELLEFHKIVDGKTKNVLNLISSEGQSLMAYGKHSLISDTILYVENQIKSYYTYKYDFEGLKEKNGELEV